MVAASGKIPAVIVVGGATATGKTALGVALAQALNGEVLSVDSQLVYRGLNIGTAKPTEQEQAGIPHHLINLANPNEMFTAARYRELALPVLQEVLSRGKRAIFVGGTGFYLSQLLKNQTATEVLPNVLPNEALRAELLEQAQKQNPLNPSVALYQQLEGLDAARARQLHPHDSPRLLRALEIVLSTGKPVPALDTTHRASEITGLPTAWVGLYAQNRPWLWQRIEARVQAMTEAGWPEEVETLAALWGKDVHALQIAHGYRDWLAYLEGKASREETITSIGLQVRQYARRQWTWFKRQPGLQWFWVDEQTPESLNQAVLAWLATGG